MHWFAITLFILGALVQGRVEPFDEVLGRGYTYVASGGAYGIVIDERYAPRFFSEISRERNDGYWTPTSKDVAIVEDLLKGVREGDSEHAFERTLEREDESGRRLVDELVSRQYVGYSTDGVKLIKVIGFCSGGIPASPLQELIVADGGACFWRAVINMDTEEVKSYSENGQA